MRRNTTVIFLDIDGVLNKRSQWKRMYSLDEGCIEAFARYANALEGPCRIVLSSSWKNGWDPAGNHSEPIARLVSMLNRHGLTISGRTEDAEDGDRSMEIKRFIRSRKLESLRCIVIDDDPSLFKTNMPSNCSFLLIDQEEGFRYPAERRRHWYEKFLEGMDSP